MVSQQLSSPGLPQKEAIEQSPGIYIERRRRRKVPGSLGATAVI